ARHPRSAAARAPPERDDAAGRGGDPRRRAVAAREPAPRRPAPRRAPVRRDPDRSEAVPRADRIAALGLDAAAALVRSVRRLRPPTARGRGRLAVLDVPRARAGLVGLPLDDTPYWLRGDQPLAGFRSRPALEGAVDVLVIGAGLTGASAAYHLAGHGL